ncbi:MAG TPA: hypothetical protein VKT21_04855 [Thermoplasmata archaeon]|nr:hypothetical protein [Thermoplasmata archaeon]
MNPEDIASSIPGLKAGGDEKMNQIVNEVDRFFKSVHADIEDWKFSMEDYGDGTRIFVRFQIHINKATGPMEPIRSKPMARALEEATDGSVVRSIPAGPSPPGEPTVTVEVLGPEGTGAAKRADLDLASFVELWRRKRDSSLGSAYHKDGAPYLDAGSEWKGAKRSNEDTPSDEEGGRTDDGPKALGARP